MKKIVFLTLFLFSSSLFAQMDIGALGYAVKVKQQRYNYNRQRIQNEILDIQKYIESADISDKRKDIIISPFREIIQKNLNGRTFDLSSERQTNDIINWLYDSINKIIKNTENIE